MSNSLQKKVEDENLATQHAIWKPMDQNGLDDFLKLSEDRHCDITLGVYTKQVRSYTQEHISEDRNTILVSIKKKTA